MKDIQGLNEETWELLDSVTDGKDQRDRYKIRPLFKDDMSYIKKAIPFGVFSKGKLSELNPLLPSGLYRDRDDIAFMTIAEQEQKGIGFVVIGNFYNESKKPDSIELFLAKKEENNEIRLWKNLKTMPGFESVYRYGNSDYVQKQKIMIGAHKDTRGSVAVENNAFDLITATRIFLDKATKPGFEKKLIDAMYKNNFQYLDTKSIFKKVDSWATKYNDLISGKLENSLFAMSQIKDTDILNPKAFMGDQFLVARKFNVDLFDEIQSSLKRASSSNRFEFNKELTKYKKELFNAFSKKEGIEAESFRYSLDKLKDFFVKHNLYEFKTNLSSATKFKQFLSENLIDKKASTSTNIVLKSFIAEEDLEKLSKRFLDQDYLGEIHDAINYFRNFKSAIETADLFKTLDRIDKRNEKVKDYLENEMEQLIKSKVDATFTSKYKYYLKQSNDKDFDNVMAIIERDTMREFYDKYNEKIEMYNLMLKNRRKSQVSEVDLIADRVNFEYDLETGKILDGFIFPKEVSSVSYLKDKERKWGYYKVAHEYGLTDFKGLPIEKRLEMADEYIQKNKPLFDKHKALTDLAKYDTVDDFRRNMKSYNKSNHKYESLAGDIISRTNDKVIGRATKEGTLEIKGAIKFEDNFYHLNFILNRGDGFNYNDYVKEMMSDRAADFKMTDLKDQLLFNKATEIYNKNYRLQSLIYSARSQRENKYKKEGIPRNKYRPEIEELNQYLSFLKGGHPRKDRDVKFGMKNGEIVLLSQHKGDKSVTHFTGTSSEQYRKIYNEIVKKLNKNYKHEVGYGLSDVYLNKDEKMQSMEKTASFLLSSRLLDKMNRSTYLAIMNRDQIINTSGASKQTGLAHGDSYLGSLGYAQPGLVWNKVTQRTFQAQDVLGEQSIVTDKGLKTVSEINADIIKRLGMSNQSFSGVGLRKGKYTTEELYKEAINKINENKGIRNAPYMRGETYKTFAIGDINLDAEGLNKYSMSFQEGMTAAKSMVLTTNSIRSKKFIINLEELNLAALDNKDTSSLTENDLKILFKEYHNKFSTDDKFFKEKLGMILDKKLYQTIEGKEKYDDFMRYLNEDATKKILDDGKIESMKLFYERIANKLGVDKKNFNISRDNTRTRMAITKEIYKLLDTAREKFGAIATPDTSQGKKKITNKEYVKTFNELKPEKGFTIRDYYYNSQTKNIELTLENIGINTQGSKGQTLGAKFTISEVQDFLKVRNGNKELFVDAVFNNKAEKRQQTGMMIHGALQTAFSNIYDTAGITGIKTLAGTMKELLSDMNVSIKVTGDNYEIDEAYLTHDYNGKKFTAETLQQYMADPTLNTGKIFNEKGAEILEKLTKKYGNSFYNGKEVVNGETAHFGIITAMQKAYSKAYEILEEEEIPLTMTNAIVSGYSNNKEMAFGKGSILLLRAASERVNSTASKKKESALKISREMLDILRVSGFKELGDFVDRKNTERLSEYLGNVYTTMNNSDILNTLYRHNQNLDMAKVSSAMSKSLRTGVLLNLDNINSDDYLLDDSELYMKHSKLMGEHSELGNIIKAKQLDTVKNGEFEYDIDVVIYDRGMNQFTKNIKSSIENTIKFLKKDTNKNNYTINFLEQISTGNLDNKDTFKYIRDNARYVKNDLDKTSSYSNAKTSLLDISMTKKFVELLQRSANSKYSMSQLKDIMNTGNILTTIKMNYGIDEADGSIVASNSFRKIQNIARKNYEFRNKSDTAANFYELYSNNNKKGAIDYIMGNLDDYYNNKIDYSSSKLFNETISNLITEDSNIIKLKDSIEKTIQTQELLRAKKEGAEYFLNKHYSDLGMSESELANLIANSDADIKNTNIELMNKKKETFNLLQNTNTRKRLRKSLDKLIFGKDKMKLNNYDISFARFFSEKQGEEFASGFELLDEYIKTPAEADKLFHKKGSITSSQKYKIKSSFVANPLEGSNLMNKIEIQLFENNKNRKDFDVKFGKLTEFLGADIVNDRLFEDDNGINVLNEISSSDGNSFQKGLEKARKIFSKNFSQIAEVTITEKQYTHSFRDQDFEWKDLYTGEDIKNKGFVRELTFLSRHPQQTINHMGGVLNITIDSKNKNLFNRKHKDYNEFVELVLSYLPREKNNAGIITFGKRTMLYRRADHDGDKVSLAFLDFLKGDDGTEERTKERIYLDFQIKNNTLGKWNEIEGRYDEFYGSILSDGKVIKLSNDREKALKTIEDLLGYNEEELNIHTKAFNTYSHAITSRTQKEFNKHYNELYEMIGHLKDTSNGSKSILTEKELNLLDNTVTNAKNYISKGRGLNKLKASEKVIDILRKREAPNDLIYDMDVVTSTALYKILKGDYKTDKDEFFKSVIKDVDKFISRGNFNEFRNSKQSKDIFDELSGQRNTGSTHTYATQLRATGIELSKMKPTDLIEKLGQHYNINTMSVDELVKIKNRQEYYSLNMDLFADNMIESAISAKHGLTLGGLEGSKIFINSLLDPRSSDMNNMILNMYENIFITNSNTDYKKSNAKLINLMENLAKYKKSFDDRNQVLEDVISDVEKNGYDKDLFYKVIDLGKEEFTSVAKKTLTKEQIEQYIKFANKYTYEVQQIEGQMYDYLMKEQYVDPKEFEIFKGLNLFGELLIQNDPGLEYEADDVLEAIAKYRSSKQDKIALQGLYKNEEIKKIFHQAFTSLGSAASISNVASMKKYIDAFYMENTYGRIYNELFEFIGGVKELESTVIKGELFEVITRDFNLREPIVKKLEAEEKYDLLEKINNKLEYARETYRKSNLGFEFELSRNITNPMATYSKYMNMNNILYTHSGKPADVSLELLKGFKEDGIESLNESSLSRSVKNINDYQNKFMHQFIGILKEDDKTFENFDLDDFDNLRKEYVDDVIKKNLIDQLNKNIDDTVFSIAKDNKQLFGMMLEPKENYIKLIFNEVLSKKEKELVAEGKLSIIKKKDIYNKSLKYKLQGSNRKYYLDDVNIFYDKNHDINNKLVDEIESLVRDGNLYLSNKVSKFFFERNKEIRNKFIDDKTRYHLAQDLLNAKKYLDEEFTKENILKRMKFEFDPKLATQVASHRFYNMSDDKFDNNFKQLFETNLNNILEDFVTVDKNLDNTVDNDNYIKMAHIYTQNNKRYLSVLKTDTKYKKLYKENLEYLKGIKEYNKKWFVDNNIDMDLFEKLASSELLNQDVSGFDNVNNILIDVAKAITGNEELSKNFKYNKLLYKVERMLQGKKKAVGITGVLGALGAGAIIKPFFSESNGKYVINGTNLTDDQILDSLNFTNGMKDDLIGERLKKNFKIPRYVDVKNKHGYF